VQALAGRPLCSWKNKNEIKLRQERQGGRPQGLCRHDGAGEFCGRKCYKDFAPDGAEAKRLFAAMIEMGKIDIAKIEADRRS